MKAFLRQNLGLKAFSLVLAYFTWAMLAQLPTVNLQGKVPVVPKVGDGYAAVLVEPREISVQVTADEIVVRRLSWEGVYVDLDLRAMREGTYTVPVQPSDIRGLPSNNVELRVLDGQVKVVLERLKKVKKPVRVQLTGKPAEGFALGRTHVAPEEVEVIGPRSAVTRLKAVLTQFVDLTGRRTSFQTDLRLLLPGADMHLRPESVRADVEIVEIPVEQELTLPVQAESPLWRCEPDEVTVTLLAPPSALGAIRSALTPLVASAKKPRAGMKVKVTPDLERLPPDLRERVELKRVEPPAVRLQPVRSKQKQGR